MVGSAEGKPSMKVLCQSLYNRLQIRLLTVLWSFELRMYYINVLKQELGSAKTYEHNLLDEWSVFDRNRCHMSAKFGVHVC